MSTPEKKKTRKKRVRWLSIAVGLLVLGLFVAAIMPKRLQVDMVSVERGEPRPKRVQG